MAGTLIDSTIKEVQERRDAITQALIGGSAKDFAEYRSMCGEIRGLSIAHTYLTDLVRKLTQNDD
jgi:hypothetical protein